MHVLIFTAMPSVLAAQTIPNGKHRTEGAEDLRAPVYFQHPSSKPDTRFLGNRIDSTGAVGVVKF